VNEARTQTVRVLLKKAEELRETLPLLPALVTWVRIILLPPAAILLSTGSNIVLVFWFVFVASFSDYFDGWLARRLKKTSYAGKILDFIADKFFLSVMFLVLTRTGPIDPVVAAVLASYHLLILLVTAVISWSVSTAVVAIPTGEKVVLIFSYVLVAVSVGRLAFPAKGIFTSLCGIGSILAVCSVFFGIISYLRLTRRLLMRFR
jgi:CDP-diacylglycerol--glycerol-3-phosphate 3-phosphatidyltransferase